MTDQTDAPAPAFPAFRAPAYADAGGARINLEIEHPVFGWIPFTLDPADTGADFDTAAMAAAVTAAGGIAAYVAPPPPAAP
ncbi:MAG: hypothetical protein GC186_16525 [Rhodobacteraceae bacterium]|nr:hypothetical protein [Paracoccaceae bacterium]